MNSDFKKGLMIGLGVGAAFLVIGFATGIVSKAF